jgi:transcriptional regulator with XRE-family HTH domain
MQEGFATRLRAERERLKFSQQRCADELGVSLSAYKSWEKERSMPADKLDGLIKLGFDYGYLLTGNREHDRARISAQEALLRVLDALEQLGIAREVTSEQLKPLIGFAFTDRSSVEELKELIRAAWAMRGTPLSDGTAARIGHSEPPVASRQRAVAPLDDHVLAACIAAIEEHHIGRKLPPPKKAKAVLALYTLMTHEQAPSKAELNRVIERAA